MLSIRISGLMLACALAICDQSRAEEKQSEYIEEIIVFSDGRALALDKSTQNISSILRENAGLASAAHINELLTEQNSIWVSRGNGQEHLTAIRSPVFTGAGACANFFVAEDTIPVRASGFCNVNQMFDTFYQNAQRIDIFRGPNSVGYGSNALFGGINVQTPDFSDDNRLAISGNTDSYASTSWRVGIDGDKLDHILYGHLASQNGPRKESGFSQAKLGWKNKLRMPGDKSQAWEAVNTIQWNHLEQETAGFIEGFDAFKDEQKRSGNDFPEAYRDASSVRAYSKWTKTYANSRTLSLRPYFRYHEMDFLMHFVPWQPTETNRHSSLGLSVQLGQSLTDHLNLDAGMQVETTQAFLSEYQRQPAPFAQQRFPTGIHYRYQVRAENISAFSVLDWSPVDALTLSASVRIDDIRYDYENQVDPPALDRGRFACEESVSNCRFFRPANRKDAFRSPSFRLSASYALPSSIFYASLGNAFRAPQASELYRIQNDDNGVTPLNDVRLSGIELGVRHDFQGWRSSLSYFSMRQRDGIYQDNERNYLTGIDTSHQGIEAELSLSITEQLYTRAGGTYARHRYRNAPNQLSASDLIQGNDIDTAPRNSSFIVVDWKIDTDWRLKTKWHRLGRYYLDPENAHQYVGHGLLDLELQWHSAKKLKLALSIKNAQNKRYAERADFAFGDYRYFPGMDRQYMLTIESRF